jgi:hypothetical protein
MSTKTLDVNAVTGFVNFDLKNAANDALKLTKSCFDMTFATIVKIQDLGEKMVRETVELGKGMQADAVKMVDLSIDNAKKGRIEYKKAVEESFKKAEELF